MSILQAFVDRVRFLKKSVVLKRQLGVRCAAGYLRNRDVPFEIAHQVLLGYPPRKLQGIGC